MTRLTVHGHGPLHETAPLQKKETFYRWKVRGRLKGAWQGEWTSVRGQCLRPWILDGDLVLVDRSLSAVDGNVVLVDMKYRRATFELGGPQRFVVRSSVKQFRVIDGEEWLSSADGWVTVRPHKIGGVVTAWHRQGWFRPRMARMSFGDRPFAPAD